MPERTSKHLPKKQIKRRSALLRARADRRLVRVTGVEPARETRWILNPLRLPVPPYPRDVTVHGKARLFTHKKKNLRKTTFSIVPTEQGVCQWVCLGFALLPQNVHERKYGAGGECLPRRVEFARDRPVQIETRANRQLPSATKVSIYAPISCGV